MQHILNRCIYNVCLTLHLKELRFSIFFTFLGNFKNGGGRESTSGTGLPPPHARDWTVNINENDKKKKNYQLIINTLTV